MSERNSISAGELVGKYQHMSREDVANETPAVISAEIVILAAKLMDVGAMVIAAERGVSTKWQELRALADTDGQADRAVKRTDEYAALLQARYVEKTIVELLRSLKKLLATKGDEARNLY